MRLGLTTTIGQTPTIVQTLDLIIITVSQQGGCTAIGLPQEIGTGLTTGEL